jgi:toxin-antitoxin system PIN domain toxin
LIALPDVNVLLALAWTNHTHHDAAHDWFAREAPAGWATCLPTQSGFLRLSLNSQVVGVAINGQTALGLLRGLVAHPDHRFFDKLPPLTDPAFDPLAVRIAGYRQLSDASLVWIASAHGMKFITFDQAASVLMPGSPHIEVLVP